MLKGMVLSISLALMWFILQLIFFHLFNIKNRISFLTKLYLLTLPLYGVFYFQIGEESFFSRLDFINGFFLLLLFYPTYLSCYFYVERPITLRILIEFFTKASPNITELEQHYSVTSMLKKRLEALERGGMIYKKGTHYFLSKKGQRIAKVISWGRSCLGRYVITYSS